jgi:hypothetical protein
LGKDAKNHPKLRRISQTDTLLSGFNKNILFSYVESC